MLALAAGVYFFFTAPEIISFNPQVPTMPQYEVTVKVSKLHHSCIEDNNSNSSQTYLSVAVTVFRCFTTTIYGMGVTWPPKERPQEKG